jgi:flagellar hook-basal body complex protein FliE
MITTTLSAIHRVGNGITESLAGRSEQTGGAAPAASGIASFSEALGDMATNAIGTMNKAEQMSVKALQGKADTREVVDAVMNAEQSLQAAIAIRDKIVSSYLEISRMQI